MTNGSRHAPRIAICGVAGYNRGDDAIAMAMANNILARLPNARIDIAMLRLGSIRRTPSIRPFLALRGKPAGLVGLIRTIARADMVILGGGSLVQDKFGASRIKGVLGYAWLVSRLAGLFGKPLITAPLGIDALHHDTSKPIAIEALGRAKRVFVRDQRSRDNLAAWATPAIDAATTRVCDPAFAIVGDQGDPSRSGYVALSPAFEGEFDDLVADTFARVAERVVSQLDRDVVLVAMDDRQHEDGGKLARIVERLSPTARARVRAEVPPTLDDALALLRGSAGVIAMRLHSVILSYGFVPVACLSRTTKTEALMEDFRVPGTTIVANTDPDAAAEALVTAVSDWPERETQDQIHRSRIAELDGFFDAVTELAQTRR